MQKSVDSNTTKTFPWQCAWALTLSAILVLSMLCLRSFSWHELWLSNRNTAPTTQHEGYSTKPPLVSPFQISPDKHHVSQLIRRQFFNRNALALLSNCTQCIFPTLGILLSPLLSSASCSFSFYKYWFFLCFYFVNIHRPKNSWKLASWLTSTHLQKCGFLCLVFLNTCENTRLHYGVDTC